MHNHSKCPINSKQLSDFLAQMFVQCCCYCWVYTGHSENTIHQSTHKL